MNSNPRDHEHLLRAALLLVGGVVIFLVLRGFFVPDGFGALGHYRAGAIDANRERAPVHAGQAACAECHGDVLDLKTSGHHRTVHCEACHGAMAAHAENPTEVAAQKPDSRLLCVRCHQVSVTRPANFPQVDREDHAGEEACATCHQPHHPEIE